MLRIAVVTVCAVVAVGCGGGSSKPNGEASKPPRQIVSDAAAALGHVKSFHLDGSVDDSDGHTTITGDIGLPGRIHLTVTNKGAHAEILLVGGGAYLKGDDAFWQQTAPKAASLFSGKWVKVPTTATAQFSRFTTLADPARIGRCFVEAHLGTLSKGGTASVDGKDTIVVTDKGDAPGSSPGRIYVAASGSPLPLRATQTGKQTPGGTPNTACNESANDLNTDTTALDLRFRSFNSSVDISAPKDALDFSKLG